MVSLHASGSAALDPDNAARVRAVGIGALIEAPARVRCFEGQGPYVWFAYEDFALGGRAASRGELLGTPLLNLSADSNICLGVA